MQKLFNILILGLSFVVLNVATVAAQTPCEEFASSSKKKEVNCLRDLLDQTPLSDTVRHAKKGAKRGFYKCGSKDRSEHVGCLRDLLEGQLGDTSSGADAEAIDACLTRSCVGVSPEYGGPEGCRKNDLTIRQCKAEVFGGHSNDYR